MDDSSRFLSNLMPRRRAQPHPLEVSKAFSYPAPQPSVMDDSSAHLSQPNAAKEGSTSPSEGSKAFSYPAPLLQPQMNEGARRGMSLHVPHSGIRQGSRSPSSKTHKCPYCATEFPRYHNLKSHLLTHSQEKPHVCSTCQSRFRRLHDLKRHTKLHTGERPHICPKCGRKFARGDALARHNEGPDGCAGRRSGGEDDAEWDDPENEVYKILNLGGVQGHVNGASSEDNLLPLDTAKPQFMSEDARLISSCYGCRQQKKTCWRNSENEKCDNCVKLGLPCEPSTQLQNQHISDRKPTMASSPEPKEGYDRILSQEAVYPSTVEIPYVSIPKSSTGSPVLDSTDTRWLAPPLHTDHDEEKSPCSSQPGDDGGLFDQAPEKPVHHKKRSADFLPHFTAALAFQEELELQDSRTESNELAGPPKPVSKEYNSRQPSISDTGHKSHRHHSDEMPEQIHPAPAGDKMLVRMTPPKEALSDNDGASLSDSCTESLVSTMGSDGELSFVQDRFSPPADDLQMHESLHVTMSDIVRGLVVDFLSMANSLMMQTPHNSTSSASATTAGEDRANIGSTGPATSLTSISKRGRSSHDSGGDDDFEDGRHRKRPRSDENEANPSSRERFLLACPHAKYDPERYSERNTNPAEASYHKCASKILTSIARLKQHLYRVHRRPEHYCSSCYAAFKTEEDRSQHERLRTCPITDCPFAEKMSPDQYLAIKRRRLGEDCVEAWFAIFGALFPHATLPGTPYVESTQSLLSRRVLGAFTAFVEHEAPARLAQRIGPPIYGSESATTYQWSLNHILEEALPAILAELRHEYQLLEVARTGNAVSAGGEPSS